jgi:hypothetical protein
LQSAYKNFGFVEWPPDAPEMMELDENRLIEGVSVWTAEDFLRYAKDCKICLFT